MHLKEDLETFFKTLITGLGITRFNEVEEGSFSPSYTRIMNQIAKALNKKISDKALSKEGVLTGDILRSYVDDLSNKSFSQKTLYVWLNALKALIMHTPEVSSLSDKGRKVIEIELDDICYKKDMFEMEKVQHSTRMVRPLTHQDIISIITNTSKRTGLLVEFLIRTACPGRRLVQLMNDDIQTDGDLSYLTIPVKNDHTRTVVVPTKLIAKINRAYTHKELLFADEARKMTRLEFSKLIYSAGQYAEPERNITINELTHTTYHILINASFTEQEAKYYIGKITDSGHIKQRMDRRLEEINTLMTEYIR